MCDMPEQVSRIKYIERIEGHEKASCLIKRVGSFLAVTVEHHAAVGTCGIRADVSVPRVLIGDNGLLHILHRVYGDLITLA